MPFLFSMLSGHCLRSWWLAAGRHCLKSVPKIPPNTVGICWETVACLLFIPKSFVGSNGRTLVFLYGNKAVWKEKMFENFLWSPIVFSVKWRFWLPFEICLLFVCTEERLRCETSKLWGTMPGERTMRDWLKATWRVDAVLGFTNIVLSWKVRRKSPRYLVRFNLSPEGGVCVWGGSALWGGSGITLSLDGDHVMWR